MTSPAPELSACVEALKNEKPISGQSFEALTDLRRDEQQYLTGEWPAIPAHMRADLMERVADLAVIDVTSDFTALGAVAINDEQPLVRRAAVSVLAESLEWRAGDRLVRALKEDQDPLVRTAAAAALEEWAILADCDMLDDEQADDVITSLRNAAMDPEAPVEVRAAALISVAGVSGDWVEPMITDFYYDEERLLRLAAVTAMGSSGLETWLDYLDEQLQSVDAEFRLAAVTSVGELSIPSTVEAVAAMLDDEDEDVVVGAITALGEIGGPLAVEYLNQFLEEAEPELIDAIETAIGYASDPAFSGFDLDSDERSDDERWRGVVDEEEDDF